MSTDKIVMVSLVETTSHSDRSDNPDTQATLKAVTRIEIATINSDR